MTVKNLAFNLGENVYRLIDAISLFLIVSSVVKIIDCASVFILR